MKFSAMRLSGWRNFKEIDIKFNPNVTIITGANATGKSTILRILAQHFGWQANMLGTPFLTQNGPNNWRSGLDENNLPPKNTENHYKLGSIRYDNGAESQLVIADKSSAPTFNVDILGNVTVSGVFIPSHRHIQNYQALTNIPTQPIGAYQAFVDYSSSVKRLQDGMAGGPTPSYRMKETLISMAMFGAGNKNIASNPVIEGLYNDFEIVLTKLLPASLGFEGFNVQVPDVLLRTKTGNFLLDAASGGLKSLIDMAWQIFFYSRHFRHFVIVLDEPENHLHPSMQRCVIQNISDAFPHAQIIVATHSPFIVTSVQEATVYVLQYSERSNGEELASTQGTVFTTLLDQINRAGTASEILREALGVPVTIPIWAENRLNEISNMFSVSDLTQDVIDDLKQRLDDAGLREFYPDAIRHIADRT